MLNRLNPTHWWCKVLDLAQEQAHQGGSCPEIWTVRQMLARPGGGCWKTVPGGIVESWNGLASEGQGAPCTAVNA